MDSELIERLEKCNDLPSIPSVAIKIIDSVRSQVDNVYEIAKIIEQDPALATKLMKHANSALYGQRREYRKIQDVVVLLGTRNTLNVALTLSLVNSLKSRKEQGVDHVRFWKRSLLAAAYARSIEKHICCTNTGEALLASLLQDIGMLALDRIAPTLYPPIKTTADYHDAARAEEQTILAVDHAAVGGWLLDTWGLPETITNAVERSHHSFVSNIESPFSAFDNTIVLSGLMADIWLNEEWGSYFDRALAFGHKCLNLSKGDFAWLLGLQGPQVSEFEALFNIELLNKRKTDKILETAVSLLNK